jgi:hypothetical protein
MRFTQVGQEKFPGICSAASPMGLFVAGTREQVLETCAWLERRNLRCFDLDGGARARVTSGSGDPLPARKGSEARKRHLVTFLDLSFEPG